MPDSSKKPPLIQLLFLKREKIPNWKYGANLESGTSGNQLFLNFTVSSTMGKCLVLMTLFSFFWWPGFSQNRAKQKPVNIIVILADDLGWADVGYDSSQIDTPNLKRLASEGMKLTSFYSSASMCSPTRAAFLTGRYPHSVGMPDLASPLPRNNVPVLSLQHAGKSVV